MMYTKGYKYRIYPDHQQQDRISRILGCCRFVYNHFLAVRRDAWTNDRKSVSYKETSRMLTELKRNPDHTWLSEADSMALQESLRNLDRSFQNFFKKQTKFPRFKSKHTHSESYRTRNQQNGIRLEEGKLRLPRIGLLKLKLSRTFEGRILHASVSRTASGKYYVSLCVEEDAEQLLKRNQGGEIGIDVGLKAFCTDSQGHIIENPRPLKKMYKKLIRAQRSLSRKQKRSGNRNKQRIKVARIHEKIRNTRKDFLQKLTTTLVRENQMIGVESLKIKNMQKNHRLAQAISDVAWSEFFQLLAYKGLWYGCDVVKVPTDYPSSQTCHVCGYKNTLVKNLAVREWECPHCHTVHDRDRNAAKNILAKARKIQSAK